MEANEHAFHSALHEAEDNNGLVDGLGGGSTGIAPGEYGRHGTKIQTSRPFRVHAYFGQDLQGEFEYMKVTLEQSEVCGYRGGCTDPILPPPPSGYLTPQRDC